ncbi:MAG TPA: hypothetical protein VGK67_08220 [Myxococcales bacterium]|jgi:hypothetical protein
MASRIADILHRAKVIDDLQLRSAGAHQAQWGGRFPTIVIEKKFASEEKVVEAISQAMRLPKVDLANVEADPAAVAKLDADFCKVNAVFPCALKDNGKTLWLAMVDPTNLPVVDEVALKTKTRINLVVASEKQVQAAIKRGYYGDVAPAAQAFGGFAIDLAVSEEEEGKIVDMSGHTLIKNIKDIEAQGRAEAAAKAAKAAAAEDVAFKDPKPGMVTGALQMLDDMFGPEDEAGPGWSEEDLARLRTIQDQQEKGARILRAVLDLCVAKGYFTPDDYRQKLKKSL